MLTERTAEQRAQLVAGVLPDSASGSLLGRWVAWDGCCDYCCQFDTIENKLTNDIVREFHARMHDLQPGCMQAWDEHVANDGVH